MEHGTIKFWGFISRYTGKDVFFHVKDCVCRTSDLVRGARVSFSVGRNGHGELAHGVTILEEDNSAPLANSAVDELSQNCGQSGRYTTHRIAAKEIGDR